MTEDDYKAEIARLTKERDDYVVQANANVCDLNRTIKQQRTVLRAVEEWWLSSGMQRFGGAPWAIFAVRAALGDQQRTEPSK